MRWLWFFCLILIAASCKEKLETRLYLEFKGDLHNKPLARVPILVTRQLDDGYQPFDTLFSNDNGIVDAVITCDRHTRDGNYQYAVCGSTSFIGLSEPQRIKPGFTNQKSYTLIEATPYAIRMIHDKKTSLGDSVVVFSAPRIPGIRSKRMMLHNKFGDTANAVVNLRLYEVLDVIVFDPADFQISSSFSTIVTPPGLVEIHY